MEIANQISCRTPAPSPSRDAAGGLAAFCSHALYAWMSAPELWFLTALTAMLFRPPDLNLYDLDRVAFAIFVFGVLFRALLLRQSLHVFGRLTLPLLGLLLLAFTDLICEPFQAQSWSVFAAKWVIPAACYHLAGLVFDEESAVQRLEIFLLIVLAYLSFLAICFLAGAKFLIFPAFIADPNLGIHADRARGPFLQAVANGLTLNILGLIALDSYRRRRLRGVLALLIAAALPLAILATKTRAVWLSFAASVVALALFSSNGRVRRGSICLMAAGLIGLLATLAFDDLDRSLQSRLEDHSPVAFRFAMYRTGWEMFCEKPWLGWGAGHVQSQLERRITDFHDEEFFFHNTYIEIAAEYGIVGLGLYAALIVGLFRLGRMRKAVFFRDSGFFDRQFRGIWPVLISVYLLNGCFVVLNYQFVNGLVFTMAGILEAQNRWAKVQNGRLDVRIGGGQ